MNYRLIATEIGDLIKYDATVNGIERSASAIFRFPKQSFPNESITSARAKVVYDWILSLAKQALKPEERNALLIQFCKSIVPEASMASALKSIDAAGVNLTANSQVGYAEFTDRKFHGEINKHSRKLFVDGYYFHAVFEACKVYNRLVQDKSKSLKDGQALMLDVWRPEGVLKITKCETDTDRNVQEGVKFLSAGLMQAMRNPTAHEPALDWPIKKDDCLDMLSFISFLLRQVDIAVYFKNQ
jgi:uncharacterized protein (TIGR02391 family)